MGWWGFDIGDDLVLKGVRLNIPHFYGDWVNYQWFENLGEEVELNKISKLMGGGEGKASSKAIY